MRTPCQGRCCIVGGECPGCGRTLEEVRNWTRMTDEERDEVMDRLEKQRMRNEEYLLQNSWSGDNPLWWKEGHAGYTVDVNKAHRFTYEEARAKHLTRRADVPWPLSVVEKGLVTAFVPAKVSKQDRAIARDIRERMVTEKNAPPKHDCYETGDPGAPDAILDSNGEVVLGLCRRCGRAESELNEPCEPKESL